MDERMHTYTELDLDTFTNSCCNGNDDDADFNNFLNSFMQELDCGRRLPTLHDHDHSDALAVAPLALAASPSCSAEDKTPSHYKKPTTHQIQIDLPPDPESKITTTMTTKKRKQQEVLEHGGVVGTSISLLMMRHVSPRDGEGSWSPVVSPSERKRDGNDDETAPTPEKKTVAAMLTFDDNIGIGLDENMYFDEDEAMAMAQYGYGGESESKNEKLCSTNTTTTNSKWDNNWQQKFSELQSFKRDNGHIDVSVSTENTRSLRLWLDRQRLFVRQYEATSTTNEVASYKRRYDLLLSIGLTGLGARDVAWETTFEELLAYRSKHHTCNVPTRGANLGRWVSKMRKQYKTYDLRKEKPDGWNDKMESRYYRLKEAGFVFCAAENKK